MLKVGDKMVACIDFPPLLTKGKAYEVFSISDKFGTFTFHGNPNTWHGHAPCVLEVSRAHKYFDIPEIFETPPPVLKCVCGAAALGSGFHSSWCDITTGVVS